jgi:hypothetical protein
VAGEEWPLVSGMRTVVSSQLSVISGQKMRREVTGGDRKAPEQSQLLRVLIAGGL